MDGGGLAAHEAAGGHLLLKHVGQSESQLMARLAAEPRITGSSSFYDRAVAESAVSDALDANSGILRTGCLVPGDASGSIMLVRTLSGSQWRVVLAAQSM